MLTVPVDPNGPIRYPHAIWCPLHNHSAPGDISQRNLVVLHCTAGPSAQSAINTFAASTAPHRTSAHFVVDRDGTVFQLLDLRDTAWHASEVNSRSVGIEHAGIPGTLLCTDNQYRASAMLVRWVCQQLNVPVDRAHVQPHSQASPADGHTLCCGGALDPDRVVQMANALTD